MFKTLTICIAVLLLSGLAFGQTYTGSDACMVCHNTTHSELGYNIWQEYTVSGHPYKLNAVDGAAPVYPANTSRGVPNPPEGHEWSDFSYVIGGYGWKARFINQNGYIFTGDNLSSSTGDSVAQYNLEDQGWVRYHVGETKAYNYDCFQCHTTGPTPDGSWNANTAGLGDFSEPGVRCEGCHGPGSVHVSSSGATPPPISSDSLSLWRCGDCHQRSGKLAPPPAGSGYIKHHEQINEMYVSAHLDGENSDLTCTSCHDAHIALRYPEAAGEELSGITTTCEDCHGDKKAVVGDKVHTVSCVSCHMPPASKSAIGMAAGNGWRGDVKTHIMKINTDAVTRDVMFNEAGSAVAVDNNGHAAVTLDFVCLRCHQDKDLDWASENAKGIHEGQGYYLGVHNKNIDPTCTTCHSSLVTGWEGTGHADAYASGSASSHFGYSCIGCHTTGWTPGIDGNGGAHNYVTEGDADAFTINDTTNFNRVKDVQCETCHGSVGTGANMVDAGHTAREADLSAELCGQCHTGSHHPTYDDWSLSLHAVSKATSIPGGAFNWISSNRQCAACHTAEGFLQFIESDELVPDVDAPGMTGNDLTCSACHDPHSGAYGGQLRMDKKELCSKCHNPEYNPDSPTPDGHELHHTTAYMFEGKGGYEYEGSDYPSSVHTFAITDKCVTCHIKMLPYQGGDPEIPAFTGHTFEPRGEACADCHNDFNIADSSFDYRSVQTEIDSLLEVLHGKLTTASSSDSTSDAFYRAKFNYDFVNADHSLGIHNTKYARALLQSAIDNFDPSAIETADRPAVITAYALNQNYPNPFNPETTIKFALPEMAKVKLLVYNITGQLVKVLANQEMSMGGHSVKFSAASLPSGIYFYVIKTQQFTQTRKMILLK